MKRTIFPNAIAASGIIALTLLVATPVALYATGAHASDDLCNVPKAEWKTTDALKEKLTAEGWDVRKIKEDDGCFEVYAITSDGKKVEAYFNPATFEQVKIEIDGKEKDDD
ncbi:MAG: PepSY domain-containing protein [Rhodospirillales bacterium]|nr:PepSY domain-containing protein [Rhodospirillales bacterium]